MDIFVMTDNRNTRNQDIGMAEYRISEWFDLTNEKAGTKKMTKYGDSVWHGHFQSPEKTFLRIRLNDDINKTPTMFLLQWSNEENETERNIKKTLEIAKSDKNENNPIKNFYCYLTPFVRGCSETVKPCRLNHYGAFEYDEKNETSKPTICVIG